MSAAALKKNSIFSKAEESVVPVQRTVTSPVVAAPAVAAAVATAPIAGAPMVSEPLREIETDYGTAHIDREAGNDESKSSAPSELLTYDEAEELKHARMTDTSAVSDDFETEEPVIDADVATEEADDARALPSFDDDLKETSFQSLADGRKEDSAADDEPKSEFKV